MPASISSTSASIVSGVTAPAPVFSDRPGILYFAVMHALQDRHEALQVEELVERRRDIAGLQAVDGRRREVDAADDDLARLLAGLLQHFRETAGDAAVLGADRLQVRMRLDVGGEHRHARARRRC